MSEVEKSLFACAVILKSKIDSFSKAITAVPKNKRTILSRYNAVRAEDDKFSKIFEQLLNIDSSACNEKHSAFIKYTDVHNLVENVEDEYNAFQDDVDVLNENKSLEKARVENNTQALRKFDSISCKFTELLDTVRRYVHVTQYSESSMKLSKQYQCDLAVLFCQLETVFNEFSSTELDDSKFNSKTEQFHTYVKSYNVIKEAVATYIAGCESLLPCNTSSKSAHSKSFSKITKLSPPVFNNDRRSYARFKADFSRVVATEMDETYQAIYLRTQCTSGRSKKLIENLDTVDDIWNILDQEFGQTEQIIQDITDRIKKLSLVQDNDTVGVINFVDTIKSAFTDLKLLSAEQAMCNPMTVREVESKMPEQFAVIWSEIVHSPESGINRDNKMLKLMEFLDGERVKACYRLNVMGRVSNAKDSSFSSNKGIKQFSKGNFNHVSENKESTVTKCLYCMSEHNLTRRCEKFRLLPLSDKKKLLLDKKACFLCIETGHRNEHCPYRLKYNWNPCKVCKQWHAHILCPENEANSSSNEKKTVQSMSVGAADYFTNETVLLPIQKIQLSCGLMATCLWDTGATGAIIQNSFAEKAGLCGTSVTYVLTKVDGTESSVESQLYDVELVDIKGRIYVIQALGINQISSELEVVNIGNIWKIFGVPSLKYHHVKRITGEINMLIGEKYAGMHPEPFKTVGNLVLKKSLFGEGWLLSGTHHKLHKNSSRVSCMNICNGRVSDVKILSLISTDSLGIDIPMRCKRCKNCVECSHHAEMLSYNEQQENLMISNGLVLNESSQKWTASYPYLKHPNLLKNNEYMCIKLFYSTERKLLRNPDDCEAYDSQVKDMINRGILIELSMEYLQSWNKAVFYLPHHAVHKETSISTPLRIVFNCSIKDKNGHSLNDCLAKGQNVLNNILGVMLRFRCHLFVGVGDISKMFHTIATTEIEWNLHRVIYRKPGTGSDLKTFAINCVSFGDRPAPAIAVTALRKTAELYESLNPQVSTQLINDSYMDDCVIGGESMEELNRNVDAANEIVSKGGFKFKGWTKSGDLVDDMTVISIPENRLLGLCWDPKNDLLYFKIKINVGNKKCGKRLEDDIRFDELDEKFPQSLTKRKCLALTNGVFDPLGLIQPCLVKLKLAFRDLVIYGNIERNMGWDDPIPQPMRDKWLILAKEMFELENLRFERRIVPLNVDNTHKPMLIIFSDGSSEALSAVSYIRWKLLNSNYHVQLVMSKCKIVPLTKVTLPRIEVMSAVMNARLSNAIQNHLPCTFSNCIHIVDSSIVLAMIQKPSVCYGEFMGCRVAEIQSKTVIDNWYWVKSENNAADISTRRTALVKNLRYGSHWQCGPEWLKTEFDSWPISQKFESNTVLPEMKKQYESNPVVVSYDVKEFVNHLDMLSSHVVSKKKACKSVEFTENSPELFFDVFKYSNFRKLIHVTAYVMKFIKCVKYKVGKFCSLSSQDINFAENFWINQIMILSKLSYDSGKWKPLRPVIKDDRVVITGRVGQESCQYNHTDLPILDPRHPVTKLIVKDVHDERHTGVDQTVALVRLKYWIPQCRKISKYVKRNCFMCRIIEKTHCEQLMKALPESRVKPGPLWYFTGLDLFGPLEIRDSVRKRIIGKCWGVIFVCHSSKAVYLTCTEDYSTDRFIQALQRFINRNGSPKVIYSDRGSQLISTAKETREYMNNLNFKQIERFGATTGFEWKFSPVKAPWYNGLPERFISILKKQLKIAIGSSSLTFGEMETVLSHIEFLINSRPIFLYPDYDPLDRVGTPLDLLIGRSDLRPPDGQFDFDSNLTRRFQFQQRLVDDFWSKWIRQTYSYLVPYQKWRHEHRNLCIGDVVYMFEKDSIRGHYQIGIIDSVKTDPDGHVRRVVVKYKLKAHDNIKKFRYSERPIQNLVVIVPVDYKQHNVDFSQI